MLMNPNKSEFVATYILHGFILPIFGHVNDHTRLQNENMFTEIHDTHIQNFVKIGL